MGDLQQNLIDIFKVVFPNIDEGEILRASTASLGEWDSVATVTLLSVIEEEFNVQFEPEDIEDMTSFEIILDVIKNEKNVSQGE